MGSKRRKSIMREGQRRFTPGCAPDYIYNSKELTDGYDRQCFCEGWEKERLEHESMLRREAAERAEFE